MLQSARSDTYNLITYFKKQGIELERKHETVVRMRVVETVCVHALYIVIIYARVYIPVEPCINTTLGVCRCVGLAEHESCIDS